MLMEKFCFRFLKKCVKTKMSKEKKIYFFSLEHDYYLQLRFLGGGEYFDKKCMDMIVAPSLKAIGNIFAVPDLILLHRNFFPIKRMWKIIEFAQQYNTPTALDVDDLITEVPKEHPKHEYYKRISKEMIALYKNVDFLIVTTHRLKEKYKAYNPNIFILPNLIDERIWEYNERFNTADKNKIIIGYSGSATHVYDFKPIIGALEYILEKYDNIKLRFIGYMPEELKKYGARVELISPISPFKEYAMALKQASFSIAIAPLIDNTFNQCKSNLKYLEYSICGYPGIYSNVGPYKDTIKHKETGYLVNNTTEDWIAAFEEFIKNPELREKLAKNAYKDVKENYTLSKKAFVWEEAYKKMLSSKTKIKNFSVKTVSYYGFYLIYAEMRKIYWQFRRSLLKKEVKN